MKQTYIFVPEDTPIRRTILHDTHLALSARMSPFAGWEMPIQYPPGTFAEHRAVRTAAGLFDISHMGVLEISGPAAAGFLDGLLTNSVGTLPVGRAQYNVCLYPDGEAVDDLFVYRLETQRFLLVVNAANADRVTDWIDAVLSRRFIIDPENPDREIPLSPSTLSPGGRGLAQKGISPEGEGEGKAVDSALRTPQSAIEGLSFRSLRDAGADSLIPLALQGPSSRRILMHLTGPTDQRLIRSLAHNALAHVEIDSVPVILARTGYTGELVAFELFLHPRQAPQLWERILRLGQPAGVLPCGLGARDSTRTEAGLPLFGHELDGPLDISPAEAGYEFVTKLDKQFFIGKSAYVKRVASSRRHVLRLRGRGRKSLRAGHVIVDHHGLLAGVVTSFAYTHSDFTFFALACVNSDFNPAPGQDVTGFRVNAESFSGAVGGNLEPSLAVQLIACSRFPSQTERESWPTRYA